MESLASWRALARATLESRPLILVGIGAEQLGVLERLGGSVRGIVSVLPAGSPSPQSEHPLLSLVGRTRNIFELVVQEYAGTLERSLREVRAFCDRVDPEREATVVSYLPAPAKLGEGRVAWIQDATLSRELEDKTATSALFQGRLAQVPARRLRWPVSEGEWLRESRALGGSSLVVQEAGLSGGGSGTWLCRSHGEAMRMVPDTVRSVRLSPWVSGEPCNVMGSVLDPEQVLVLPPSRQIICWSHGRPVYAGNDLGDLWSEPELAAIRSEVRSFGRRLAELGFLGPFGLDFLRTADGRRHYHDLNPRMNGVVDSLALYFDADGPEGLRALLLARREWAGCELASLETALDRVTSRHPMARFFLSRQLDRACSIETTPPAGTWRLGQARQRAGGRDRTGSVARSDGQHRVHGLELQPVGPAVPFHDLGDDQLLLHPLVSAGSAARKGDRLVLGDLCCALALADRLRARYGDQLHGLLFNAILG